MTRGVGGGAYRHNGDRDKLESLGLDANYEHVRDWQDLGTVQLDSGGSVKVEVSCWPAQFWRFTIRTDERPEPTVLGSGSGGFVDYWPTAKLFADAMLQVIDDA